MSLGTSFSITCLMQNDSSTILWKMTVLSQNVFCCCPANELRTRTFYWLSMLTWTTDKMGNFDFFKPDEHCFDCTFYSCKYIIKADPHKSTQSHVFNISKHLIRADAAESLMSVVSCRRCRDNQRPRTPQKLCTSLQATYSQFAPYDDQYCWNSRCSFSSSFHPSPATVFVPESRREFHHASRSQHVHRSVTSYLDWDYPGLVFVWDNIKKVLSVLCVP